MNKIYALCGIVLLVLAACEGKVSITKSTFDPKIVIQATLVPGVVPEVRLSRNYPLDVKTIDLAEIPLTDARATISDEQGVAHELLYNAQSETYVAADLVVEHGKSYTLDVSAEFSGQSLKARSTTRVPVSGFSILREESRLQSMPYRQRDEQGDIVNFEISFQRSPSTGFYLVSIVAIDPDTANYIYDNPFNENSPQDVLADFDEYKYNYYYIQDRPLSPGVSTTEILSLYTYFYGRYRIVVYAADSNLRGFTSTHEVLQGADGNFHEGAFYIDGDGIGVFGSALTDTVYIEVLRP